MTKTTGGLTVHFAVDGIDSPSILHVVAVIGDAMTEVQRGENGGRSLRHSNVATAVESQVVSKKRSGDIALKIADGVKPTSIIAFVQKPNAGAVVGATVTDIPK